MSRAATAVVALSCLTVLAFLAATRHGTLPGLGAGAKSDGAAGGAAPNARGPAPVWHASEGPLSGHVVARARALASRPYEDSPDLPAELLALDYDGYRSIRFRSEASLWRGAAAFEIQLFHPGSIHDDVVEIYEVDGDAARPVSYDPALFSFTGAAEPLREIVPGRVGGFAGFRVLHPLNQDDAMDEVVSFLGASYFRVIGRDQVYGLSSRGLAVDPAVDGPEEFPAFIAYWLERPEPGARQLTFHALLDGPSVTGAFHFVLTPGAETTVDVEARIFARHDVAKLGVAPMSSMFLHAPGRGPTHDDFRPRVHDSDGLSMRTGSGEWIWRPLSNGPGLHVTTLRDEAPSGFGLMQRARAFDGYLDLEARYDRRPSVWVDVLGGDWGAGGVELLEIPTTSEFNDNIATYWVPDRPMRAGEDRTFRYRIRALGAAHPDQRLGRVLRTLVGADALPGEVGGETTRRRVIVDFAGDTLAWLGAPPTANLSLHRGVASDIVVQGLPEDGGWRVTFVLEPEGEQPADMRLFLETNGRPVSETWSYVWYR